MIARNKRIIIWGMVLAVLAVAVGYSFAPRPIPVDLYALKQGSMLVAIEEEGQTRIHDVYLLSAPVAGRVQRIEAHVGDPVRAGDTVLAQITPGDPSFLDPRSEAQARAALEAAKAAQTLAESQVEEAEAELDFAAAEWTRANRLKSEAISRSELDEAQRTYKICKAALATARAALGVRMFEVEQARFQLMTPAELPRLSVECECVPITAPVSGTVLRVEGRSERIVPASAPLLEIGDPRDLEIVADLLSADAVRVQAGQRVIIDGWGGAKPLEGRVRRVEPLGFTKTSALGIEEQRVNVIIDFVTPLEEREALGHGYQVDTRVVLWESSQALTVPLTAIFRRGEAWAVFHEQEGRARETMVELGQRNGLVAEIVAGLKPGDRVVAHPSDRIRDGVRVAAR